MDEFTLLKRMHENKIPTQESLTRGRATLFSQITNPGPAPRPVITRRRIGGLSALAAFGIAVALVASNVAGLGGWRGGADSAAAAVLERAATVASSFQDAKIGAGQYLLVKSKNVHVTDGQEKGGPVISHTISESSDLYVPSNRDGQWLWQRNPIRVVNVLTPGGEAMVARSHPTSGPSTKPTLLAAAGGAFFGHSADSQWGDFDSMPRDAYRLLNHIYLTTFGAGSSPDGEALVFIADTLRQGTVPADLRAALLRAAAMIPGVTITNNQATLDGTTGTAIGRLEGVNGLRSEIIIDPETGTLIGERAVATRAIPESSMKAGDVWSWSSVTTSVVNFAPTGSTSSGAAK